MSWATGAHQVQAKSQDSEITHRSIYKLLTKEILILAAGVVSLFFSKRKVYVSYKDTSRLFTKKISPLAIEVKLMISRCMN